jgi:hypothetical protein
MALSDASLDLLGANAVLASAEFALANSALGGSGMGCAIPQDGAGQHCESATTRGATLYSPFADNFVVAQHRLSARQVISRRAWPLLYTGHSSSRWPIERS